VRVLGQHLAAASLAPGALAAVGSFIGVPLLSPDD